VESGQLTPSAVAAGLPHAQDPESVAIDWHIHHTIAAMEVNGLGRRRDAEVCNVLCLFFFFGQSIISCPRSNETLFHISGGIGQLQSL
jgi:hypothetical protein